MTKQELRQHLRALNIDNDMCHLDGGLPNEAFTLNQNGNIWEVYYGERGLKSGLKTYQSENEACQALFNLITQHL